MSKNVFVLPKLEMTSREIAELTGKAHSDVLYDINKTFSRTGEKSPVVKEPTDTVISEEYPNLDLSLGVVTKSTYKNSQNKTQPMYILDKKASYVLVSGYSAELRAACFDYIEKLEAEINELKANERKRHHFREAARLGCPAMTDAISDTRKMMGKDTQPYHYANEFDMINRIVLNMTAKQYRKVHGIVDAYLIRDYLGVDQIKRIEALQQFNTNLISAGVDFEQRKFMLQTLDKKTTSKYLK